MTAASLDLTSNPFERFVNALIEWVTPRDRPTEADTMERTIRELTAPFVDASDEAQFDRAFVSLERALPVVFQSLPRLNAGELDAHLASTTQKLPWLLQRVAGDVEPPELSGEFGALLQFHLRNLSRLVERVPAQALKRAAEMSASDVAAAARDPVGGPLFQVLLALMVLVGLHEALGRSDEWRRRRLLVQGRAVLRALLDRAPMERTFAATRWLMRNAREVGLWLPSGDLANKVASALAQDPPNRGALETLAERLRTTAALVYVDDVDATFVELMGGESFFGALDAGLAAGETYERGGLSIEELARRWSVDVSDAVARLESSGFVRPSSVLRLGDDERRERLARLNTDRAERRGETVFDPDIVRRSVIASQRIEGIDARPHVRRTPPRDPS